MIIIAFIAYLFWAVLGFLFWIPLLVRVISAFCGSLVYNMIIHNPSNIHNSKTSLDLAINFYAKGFKSIHSALYEDKKPDSSASSNNEFHFLSFFSQVLWSIVFWGTIIIPLTGTEFNFRRQYAFKETFDTDTEWMTYENNHSSIKVKDNKLIVQCKDDPNDNSYGVVFATSRFLMYNCPSKYTIYMTCELINGDFNKPFGLILTDTGERSYIKFQILKEKYGKVSIVFNNTNQEVSTSGEVEANTRIYKIKLEVKGNVYTYFLNNKKIHTDNFGGFTPYYFGAFVYRTQIAEFSDVEIVKN
jgi:hypothetical protein